MLVGAICNEFSITTIDFVFSRTHKDPGREDYHSQRMSGKLIQNVPKYSATWLNELLMQ